MNWNNIRVLVLGDVMLDRWIYTSKIRVSPEAPIPIVNQQEYFSEMGGAGNVLRHLNNLSLANHHLIGVCGVDQVAAELKTLEGLDSRQIHFITDSSRSTTLKERFFIDDIPLYRKDIEEVHDLSKNVESEVLQQAKDIIKDFSVLLLSDYAKGVLSKTLIQELLDLAKRENKPVVCDPGFGRIALFVGCDIIKPNAIEWQEYVATKESEKIALDALFAGGTRCVIITDGKNGIRYFVQGNESRAIPVKAIDVVDVTGAGDSLAAVISLIVGAGLDLVNYLDILNEVGGQSVLQNRTSLPNLQQIRLT